MKKITALFFAIIILLQMNQVSIAAERPETKKLVITVTNIDTSALSDLSRHFTTEIKVDGVASSSVKIINEKWLRPEEFIIAGKNIPITDGIYSYQLRIRSDGTLDFNNDLEILYQGIDGRYKLDYTIDETDNHIMVVTGTFKNIITQSPALDTLPGRGKEWVQDNFSDDSYFYELNLRTKEGFTMKNRLQFLFRSTPCVYSVDYMYELLNDGHTLTVNGATGSDFAYYGRIVARKQAVDNILDNADDYRPYIAEIAKRNKEVFIKAVDRAESITGISGQEAVSRIEEIVNEHKEAVSETVNNIDVSEIQDRVSSFFGGFGY